MEAQTTPPTKWLTWGRSAWIVAAIFTVGLFLGMWWPLWLIPPRLSDTAIVYVVLSQLWLVVLIIFALLRPSSTGRLRMLKAFAVMWPWSAFIVLVLSSGIWTIGGNFILAVAGPNGPQWLIYLYYLLLWAIFIYFPLAAFRKWIRPDAEQQPKLGRLPVYLGAGVVVTIVFVLSILGNVALAEGGIFNEPLSCAAPVISQGQMTYACHQNSLDSGTDYVLTAAQGSPVGQLRLKSLSSR